MLNFRSKTNEHNKYFHSHPEFKVHQMMEVGLILFSNHEI